MILIGQIALTIGIAANTVSIWLLIASKSRLSARIEYLEILFTTMLMDKEMFTKLRKV
jgi:hypothetical protein